MSLFSLSDIREKDIRKKDNTDWGADQYNDKIKLFMEENVIMSKRTKSQYKIVATMVEDLDLPKKGEVIRMRTQRQLNLFCIVAKILYIHGKIDMLYISTYTLNNDIFDNLVNLVNGGKIGKLKLLVASSYSFRNEKMYNKFKTVCFATENINLVFANSHMKISIATTCGQSYHWEGSMNYSINNLAENLIMSNDADLCKKDMDFIDKIVMDAKNKSLEIIC